MRFIELRHLIAVLLVFTAVPLTAAELYVAPAGNDSNGGTRDKPFATLERARDEVRALKRAGGLPAGGVTIVVHGGKYRVAQTFTLAADDSGTPESPIVYRAAEGETPKFTGGSQLKGFSPVSSTAVLARLPEEARRKVVQIDLKPLGLTDLKPLVLGGFASGNGFRTYPIGELFFDGRAMPLARWPNEGMVHVVDIAARDDHQIHGIKGSKTGRFFYEGDRPSRWQGEPDAILYGYWFWDWADSYERIASIDPAKREITLATPWHTYGYRKGARYCAVNLLSEIDVPGEWYLDRPSGILYFYPPSDPGQAVVEFSRMEKPLVQLENTAHVRFQRFVWELGAGDAIVIRGGRQCVLAGCTIRRCGGNGIEIHGGSGHAIRSCDIYSLGRGGTVLSGGDRKTLQPGGHVLENCHIYELSRIDHTYTPAVVMSGVGNRIAHNLIHHIASSALRLGGNDHLVELNEIHNVVLESDDQGGADMWGDPTYRGNVYRHNYWHHIGNWRRAAEDLPCGEAGIRLDDAICGVQIEGNVFYKASAGKAGFGGVQIHGGKDNLLVNNLFVKSAAAISFSPWGENRWREYTAKSLDSPEINRDLYLSHYPALAQLSEDHDVNEVRRNVIFDCGEFLRRGGGGVKTNENLITNENPGLSDSGRGVFGFDPATPALKAIGFELIPFEKIGLYQDEFRKTFPREEIDKARAE